MMGLTLDLRRESNFGEATANLDETVKMETEKASEQSKKKPKVKKPRKQRKSLEPRVSTPDSRPSPVTNRSPKSAPPDSNAELEAKLASMWGARKPTNIFENRNDTKPTTPIVVQSPQKQSVASGGRACSLCKERFENLKELGSHIEKVHKPARGRASPRMQSPLEMGAMRRSPGRPSSPLLGRKSGQRSNDFSWKMSSGEKPSKKKNVFDVPQAFNSNQGDNIYCKSPQRRKNW